MESIKALQRRQVGPLATVVIGGLVTSTALTLLLLPLIYEWVETRFAARFVDELHPSHEEKKA